MDWEREARTGMPEAVMCQGKTVAQIEEIVREAAASGRRLLFTRLWSYGELAGDVAAVLEFDPLSGTAVLDLERGALGGTRTASEIPEQVRDDEVGVLGDGVGVLDGGSKSHAARGGALGGTRTASEIPEQVRDDPVGELDGGAAAVVGIVTAGTSDLAVAAEARRTLEFCGYPARIIADVGVAGLWRLTSRIAEIRRFRVVIAVAGFEGALFSVLAGLIRAPLIACPTSVGYGVASGGRVALDAALASCAPGVAVVNIDNGFGAAALAIKILGASASG
ncbi:MAG: nickel pincer cofactor biosynthesis protein LarB [Propionibacteriaceae bacterium]|nr:nickel pincer cofactor biosynthesis protein LarB [Propionibacteriaceae bacterium]